MSLDRELSIVMPVYNEAEGVESVIDAWMKEFDRLGIGVEFLAYNDGSRDETGRSLDRAARRYPDSLRVVHQENRGHGPTIVRGYGESRGEWVFQTDSDDEIPASAFEAVWRARGGHDAVFGIRTGRQSGAARRLLTRGAATSVHLLFGAGPSDVNVPFRLIRRATLGTLLPRIPDDVFAPNVILSGLVARDRIRFTEVPVPSVERRLGQTTIFGWRTLKLGLRAARETAAAARRDPGRRQP